MIHKCTCVHPYQDKRYGRGLRVFNPTEKGTFTKIWGCTVCEAQIEKGKTGGGKNRG